MFPSRKDSTYSLDHEEVVLYDNDPLWAPVMSCNISPYLHAYMDSCLPCKIESFIHMNCAAIKFLVTLLNPNIPKDSRFHNVPCCIFLYHIFLSKPRGSSSCMVISPSQCNKPNKIPCHVALSSDKPTLALNALYQFQASLTTL